jgi:release factor glutamine methyltransferase
MAQAVQEAPAGSLLPGMTVGQARRALAERFRAAGLDSPELDARLLAGHALGLDRTGLAVEAARGLADEEVQSLAALAGRRLAREPVARILGSKEFWGLSLRIGAATLVPRPETETVVEAALAAIDGGGPRMRIRRIADLGTGSGALLISLLSELPNAFGVGTDVSFDALAVARDNALRHGMPTRAKFIACDFGAALCGGFDLVVCNPPYVATGEIAALPPEVQHDPRRALDGGADGLACYRAIAAQAPRLLAPTGHLVVEIGVNQDRAVAELLQSSGLAPSSLRSDLAGIPRALHACVATKRP